MAGEPNITVIGNMTADPELRFTPSGAAVANFTVACTPRTKQGDEWVDGEATFYNCSVWRDYAEHVVESLAKGQRVIVSGRLKTRKWEGRDGAQGLSVEIDVDEVGHSLRFGTATFSKGQRADQGGGQQQRGQTRGGQQSRPQNASQGRSQDPWSTGDEPPF